MTASLHSVIGLQRMRDGNVFVSTRRRSKVCDGRVDVRGDRVILARASSVKSSTVRHKLDLGAVVAVCWDCDVGGACERLDRLRYGGALPPASLGGRRRGSCSCLATSGRANQRPRVVWATS